MKWIINKILWCTNHYWFIWLTLNSLLNNYQNLLIVYVKVYYYTITLENKQNFLKKNIKIIINTLLMLSINIYNSYILTKYFLISTFLKIRNYLIFFFKIYNNRAWLLQKTTINLKQLASNLTNNNIKLPAISISKFLLYTCLLLLVGVMFFSKSVLFFITTFFMQTFFFFVSGFAQFFFKTASFVVNLDYTQIFYISVIFYRDFLEGGARVVLASFQSYATHIYNFAFYFNYFGFLLMVQKASSAYIYVMFERALPDYLGLAVTLESFQSYYAQVYYTYFEFFFFFSQQTTYEILCSAIYYATRFYGGCDVTQIVMLCCTGLSLSVVGFCWSLLECFAFSVFWIFAFALKLHALEIFISASKLGVGVVMLQFFMIVGKLYVTVNYILSLVVLYLFAAFFQAWSIVLFVALKFYGTLVLATIFVFNAQVNGLLNTPIASFGLQFFYTVLEPFVLYYALIVAFLANLFPTAVLFFTTQLYAIAGLVFATISWVFACILQSYVCAFAQELVWTLFMFILMLTQDLLLTFVYQVGAWFALNLKNFTFWLGLLDVTLFGPILLYFFLVFYSSFTRWSALGFNREQHLDLNVFGKYSLSVALPIEIRRSVKLFYSNDLLLTQFLLPRNLLLLPVYTRNIAFSALPKTKHTLCGLLTFTCVPQRSILPIILSYIHDLRYTLLQPRTINVELLISTFFSNYFLTTVNGLFFYFWNLLSRLFVLSSKFCYFLFFFKRYDASVNAISLSRAKLSPSKNVLFPPALIREMRSNVIAFFRPRLYYTEPLIYNWVRRTNRGIFHKEIYSITPFFFLYTSTFEAAYWMNPSFLKLLQANEPASQSIKLNNWLNTTLNPDEVLSSADWRNSFNSPILNELQYLEQSYQFLNPHLAVSRLIAKYFNYLDPDRPIDVWTFKRRSGYFSKIESLDVFQHYAAHSNAFSTFWLSAYLDSHYYTFDFVKKRYDFLSVEAVDWVVWVTDALFGEGILSTIAGAVIIPLKIPLEFWRNVFFGWAYAFYWKAAKYVLEETAFLKFMYEGYYPLYRDTKFRRYQPQVTWVSSVVNRWQYWYVRLYEWSTYNVKFYPHKKSFYSPNMYALFEDLFALPLPYSPIEDIWALKDIEAPKRLSYLAFTGKVLHSTDQYASFVVRGQRYGLRDYFFNRQYRNPNNTYYGGRGRDRTYFYETHPFRYAYLHEVLRTPIAVRRLNPLFSDFFSKFDEEAALKPFLGRWNTLFAFDTSFYEKIYFRYWASKQTYSLKALEYNKFQFFKIFKNFSDLDWKYKRGIYENADDSPADYDRYRTYRTERLNTRVAFFFKTLRQGFLVFDEEWMGFRRISRVFNSYELAIIGRNFTELTLSGVALTSHHVAFKTLVEFMEGTLAKIIYYTSVAFNFTFEGNFPVQQPLSSYYHSAHYTFAQFTELDSRTSEPDLRAFLNYFHPESVVCYEDFLNELPSLISEELFYEFSLTTIIDSLDPRVLDVFLDEYSDALLDESYDEDFRRLMESDAELLCTLLQLKSYFAGGINK